MSRSQPVIICHIKNDEDLNSNENTNQKKTELPISLWNKVNFKTKKIYSRGTLHNDKKINPLRRNNDKCLVYTPNNRPAKYIK